jgi:hypothetical protein
VGIVASHGAEEMGINPMVTRSLHQQPDHEGMPVAHLQADQLAAAAPGNARGRLLQRLC